jgi:hypothetical protein
MPRYQLGSRLLWLKSLAIGLYVGFVWLWPGFARTPLEKTIWGIFVLVFTLWSVGSVGYADDKGIHYRKLIRIKHGLWPEVNRVEWIAEQMTLWVTVGETVVNFKYRGIAPLFGSRQRPEAVNFAQRKLTEIGLPGRFVCKTSLVA